MGAQVLTPAAQLTGGVTPLPARHRRESARGTARRQHGVRDVVRGVPPASERGTRGCLGRNDPRVAAAGELLPNERKREAAHARPATNAADQNVGGVTGELELAQRLLADDRLMQYDVVDAAA